MWVLLLVAVAGGFLLAGIVAVLVGKIAGDNAGGTAGIIGWIVGTWWLWRRLLDRFLTSGMG